MSDDPTVGCTWPIDTVLVADWVSVVVLGCVGPVVSFDSSGVASDRDG